jgi:hypothetical protein
MLRIVKLVEVVSTNDQRWISNDSSLQWKIWKICVFLPTYRDSRLGKGKKKEAP